MTSSASDDLFRDPDLTWRAVSPRLSTEWRVPAAAVGVIGLALLVAGLLGLLSGLSSASTSVGALLVVAAVVAWVAVDLARRTWRYAERAEDLLVSRGRLYRRLTVIPYGRMQVIEVSANPLSRWLGIATVTLVTASASTDAHIPGLPVAEAHDLRDRLAAKGQAMSAGL